jgi:predicted RNase H-like HicB family nuclease
MKPNSITISGLEYRTSTYYDHTDKCFVMSVLDIPSAMADGETEEEALTNLKEVIEILQEEYEADGTPWPAPFK